MWHRIWAFLRSAEMDRDFQQELQLHLEMLTEEYRRRGMTPEEARRAARIDLGGVTQLKEAHRAARGLPFLDTVWQDIRYGVRAAWRNPGFAAIAVLTLSVGIGVNTAVFTAYNAAILRPVEAADPDRLVQITRDTHDQFLSYPDFAFYRDSNRGFAGMAAVDLETHALGGVPPATVAQPSGITGAVGFQFPHALQGSVEKIGAALVSGNYFQMMAVGTTIGRALAPEDDRPGADAVALMSDNYWERRFGRAPGMIGRSLLLDGIAVTIIGVTPRDYTGTLPVVPNLWLPLSLTSRFEGQQRALADRNSVCCRVYARLRPGVLRAQAEAEMNALSVQLYRALPDASDRPASQRGHFVLTAASPNGPRYNDDTTALAAIILGAVSLVLVIACANVASLVLARSAARQREIAIRLAIGAGRGRLIRQLLTEAGVISLLAGVSGTLFSWWSLRILLVQIAASVPGEVSIVLHLTPDLRVLAYMLFLSIGATAMCGLAPALEASKPNLTGALKEEVAAFGVRLRKGRLRDVMVGSQVAVCLVLLIGASLLARTSQKALNVDLGFDYSPILFLGVSSPPSPQANAATYRSQLLHDLASLPEIESVAAASRVPLGGGLRTLGVSLHGERLTGPGAASAMFNMVSPGYFETMAIPIVRGRGFTAQEGRDGFAFDGSPVIVSEATARRLWPGDDPIGRRIAFGPGREGHRFAGEQLPHSASSVVIGVAKDVRSVDLLRVDATCLYFPVKPEWGGSIVLRSRYGTAHARAAIEREFQTRFTGLEAAIADSRAAFTDQSAFVASRIGAIGSAIIGVFGLLMASVGIYGTVRFAVTQRVQEIGIRMALGAQRMDVLRLVLRETMRPVAIGLALGFVGSAAISRVMSSFLFGLSSLDPVSFLGASGFLGLVALIAGYLPARRSTRIDPMIALRYE
jgi:predicted permease